MRKGWTAVLLLVGIVAQSAALPARAVHPASASAASASAASASAASASAAVPSVRVLEAGQRRYGGSVTTNGPARFEVSTSSFVVLYEGTLNGPDHLQLGDSCWQVVNPAHPSLNVYVELTTTGEFRLVAPGVGVLWHAGTAGRGGQYLLLTRTGNLVLTTAAGKVVWQSTSGPCWLNADSALTSKQSLRKGFVKNGKPMPWIVLAMQANGNLVLRYGSTTVWQVRPNVPGSYLRLASDGELIVRSPSGKALWRSGRHAKPGCACFLDLNIAAPARLLIMDYTGGRSVVVWRSPPSS